MTLINDFRKTLTFLSLNLTVVYFDAQMRKILLRNYFYIN